ncbi:TonB-dependent receptor [Vibrio natriegens]|uniref:TonB-dependent receptor domain-containing protein n=1 Tax=Vibrio natriegens TaxID=691 RepID=UPI0021E72DB5|nr:TonB-dependent receptor [Vibrio natriegens]UYI50019.1 TonB-dependent receptor [Vibrio natriegens]
MKLTVLSVAVATTFISGTVFAETAQTSNTEVMVVTATKNQTYVRDAPASITVIDNETLNRTPANDVASVLETVPGLQVVRTSGSEPYITIRGLKNNNSARDNYTLMLINGRRITSAETMVRGATFDFSSIPMSAIDHIEVIRGPMSSLYGSDALGGVVNVILKQPTDDTQVNASLSYSQPENGGGAMEKGNIFVSGAGIPDKLLYTVTAEFSHQDDWFPDDVNSGNTFSGNAEEERSGLHTSLNWLINDANTVLFDAGYMKNDRTFPDADKDDTSDDDITNSEKYTLAVGHQGLWGWGDSDVYYLYEHSEIYDDNSHPLLGVTNSKQQNHSLDGKLTLTNFERQVITTGINATTTSIDIDKNYDGKQTTGQQAIFIQDQISLTETFAATLSGRFTHHDDFGSDFTPRAYLVYNPTDRFTVKGGYAEGFKTPTIYQTSEDFSLVSCGGSCYLTGNPDLKAETSKTYELASSYNADHWFVQATVFYNEISNMIDRDTSTRASGWITYQNIDEAESKGVELEGQLDILDNIDLTANATYTNAKDKSDDTSLENVARWLSNVSLNWYATDRLSLYTSANYTGKQWDGDTWLDPYVVANLGGSYDFNSNWTVKAGVTNFLDENLESDDQDYSENVVGRTYFVTLDMSF